MSAESSVVGGPGRVVNRKHWVWDGLAVATVISCHCVLVPGDFMLKDTDRKVFMASIPATIVYSFVP